MSGRFVRASKYRHVYGQQAKRELSYDNIKISTNAWDSNLIKANPKYISVNWNSSGGGAFAVIPVEEIGKAPDQVPLFRGHTATVLDTDFNPFNDNIIISGSDDAKLGVWRIPDDYSFHNYTDENGAIKDIAPVALYTGHKRKVGHVQFHPTAENVAATSSLDYTIKLWDIENGKDKITLAHKDLVTSFSFNYNGNLLATTSRDRQLRVWDIRANQIVSEGPGHTGAKASRVVWLGNSDRIGTTGFSRLSDRQLGVWDSGNIGGGPIGGFYTVDASSGVLIPFYDESNKILYVGGKGDGNIRYFEFQDDELFPLSEFQSTDAQRGLAVAPKRAVNVTENEVVKAYKTVRDTIIEPITFIVPRKSEVFQDDIYPDAPAGKAALTADEWFDGKSVDGPILFNLESLYDPSKATEFRPSSANSKSPQKQEAPSPKTLKTESKPEAKPDPKAEIKSESKESTPTSRLTPLKSNVDDLLQKDEVNSLLNKAAELDDEDKPLESNWDDEDDELKKPVVIETSKETLAEPVKVSIKEDKVQPKKTEEKPKVTETPKAIETPKVTPKVEEDLKPVVKAETPKGAVKEQTSPVATPSAVTDSTPATATAAATSTATPGAKTLTLKGSIDKLASIVDHFEGVVSRLEAANLEKDERIRSLEEKVQALIEKK